MTWDEITAALRERGKPAELDALERCAHERTIVRAADAGVRTREKVRAELAATVTRYLGALFEETAHPEAHDIIHCAIGVLGPPEPYAAVLWACAVALNRRERRALAAPAYLASMGCLCAGHARGDAASAACDTFERPRGKSQQRGTMPHGAAHDADRWREKGK